MIVFDTDHLSIIQFPEHPQYERLVAAIDGSSDIDIVATAISLEEQMRGWLAAINRARDVQKQIPYYSRLTRMVDFYSRWIILPFDEAAASRFSTLRKAGLRVGTMDLKIASIALANNAVLTSANLRDFEQVPGLRVVDWLR
jgi:tRNA(fMet)-specific endonuclease VapC